jgi:uncharacterized protein YjbI with pentapeptide repeats
MTSAHLAPVCSSVPSRRMAFGGSVLIIALSLAFVLLHHWQRKSEELRGTILSGATLTDANLAGANFFKSVLDAADLAGANLIGAQFLNCAQLETTRNWQLAFRDPDLACGAPVPMIADPP